MEKDGISSYVGIDLGTTNTSASFSWIGTDGQVHPEDLVIRQKARNSQTTKKLLPSIMYRKPNGEEVVGCEAKDLKETNINAEDSEIRFLENTKRYIGTRKNFIIDKKTYTPIDVATLILEHVKNYSQIKNKIKGEYNTIITVPANFNNDQRNDTLEAAHRAGFQNVELYDEPKAAILSFLHEESQKIENKLLDVSNKKRILVIDIGGGTCDISVEDVVERNGQYVFTHMAVGRENLGGVDFDKRVGDELSKKCLKGIKLNDSQIASIRNMGQKVKETLSDDIDYYICENYDGDDSALYTQHDWIDILDSEEFQCEPSLIINGETIYFPMNVREFINAINPLIYQMEETMATNKDERERNKNMELLIKETLKNHDINLESINVIFLTGGMAKCLPLRAALFDLFQKPIISPSDPLLAVSKGAGFLNKYKTIDETSRDLMPNAVMMEMGDGHLKTLVQIGEQIPITKTVSETFKTQSRNGVIIRLFEGKNEYDSQLRRINNMYVIKFDFPMELEREFSISYTVDRTKRIKFVIKFFDTSEEYEINGAIREGKVNG